MSKEQNGVEKPQVIHRKEQPASTHLLIRGCWWVGRGREGACLRGGKRDLDINTCVFKNAKNTCH